MIYVIEVRAQAGTNYFQPFKTTLEAPTASDALERVKRQYPDCTVWVCDTYNASAPSRGGSSGRSGGLGGAALLLFGAVILGSIFGGGGSDKPAPAAPRAGSGAPAEYVAPSTPSYANPPGPCVTANFEPC